MGSRRSVSRRAAVVEMEDQSKKKAKHMELKTPKIITDLGRDELRNVLIIFARSGPQSLLRVMTVCKMFSEVGKFVDVLRALKFDGMELSEDNVKIYQHINSLVSLAAQAGNETAQILFGKVIMMSCTLLIQSIQQPSSKIDLILDCISIAELNSLQDGSSTYEADTLQAQTFMTQLNSEISKSSNALHHCQFVKASLRHCHPRDFKSLNFHLSCYKDYHRKDSVESRRSLRKMWEVSNQMSGYTYYWKWKRPMGGDHALTSPTFSSMLAGADQDKQGLIAEFEELRSQALEDLENVFLTFYKFWSDIFSNN